MIINVYINIYIYTYIYSHYSVHVHGNTVRVHHIIYLYTMQAKACTQVYILQSTLRQSPSSFICLHACVHPSLFW